MHTHIKSASIIGVRGYPVDVEVHVASGLPAFQIVGLPDASCREAKDRVRAAIQSTISEFPSMKITVNLAPSDLKKSGPSLDLAIAVGILAAAQKVPIDAVDNFGFLGELGLDGTVRPIRGALPMADAVECERLVAAAGNDAELTLLDHAVHPVSSLREVIDALNSDESWPDRGKFEAPRTKRSRHDLRDIRGQHLAKLALAISAAGGHHLLMVGPPGAGKTMLARRLPGLLSDLSHSDALEVTRIHSAAGELSDGQLPPVEPPFRAPHHSASAVSLIGGGASSMRPGEISLAHRGVLFLDELGEFSPGALDGLRHHSKSGSCG